MHLVCPDCSAINRVPNERLDDKPVCGKCGSELTPRKPKALGDANLFRYLEKTEMPVLVDFWAEWCGPCRSYGPQFEQLAATKGDVRFVKVNSDQAPQASARLNVRSIPTTILFEGGREKARISGALSAAQLDQWLSQWLNKQGA